MREALLERLTELLKVKSLVTLVLTGVFAALTVIGRVSDNFMTVYAVIIAFYFGIQSTREAKTNTEKGDENGSVDI